MNSNYSIEIWPDAENDIDEIFLWYESKSPGLGYDFLLCLDAVITSIKRNPYFSAEIEYDVRRTITERFPYNVYYFNNQSIVSIIAVIHQSRHPDTWKKRF